MGLLDFDDQYRPPFSPKQQTPADKRAEAKRLIERKINHDDGTPGTRTPA